MKIKLNQFINKLGSSTRSFRLVFSISLLVLFIVFSASFFKIQKLSFYQNKIENLNLTLKKTEKIRNAKKAFFQKYANSDPNFIEEKIQSIVFLNDEIQSIENKLKFTLFKENSKILNRLNFLKSKKNQLFFKNIDSKSNAYVIENEFQQINQIELNYNNFFNLLSLIEKVKINDLNPYNNSPLLIITKLQLKATKEGTLLLNNLAIQKREFINHE